jgi:hypothetical protein
MDNPNHAAIASMQCTGMAWCIDAHDKKLQDL